jgi:hypothetical protein
MASVLSCKKKEQAAPQVTNSGPAPTVYPCSSPNFTNTINSNGQKLVKSYVTSSNGFSRSTFLYYYDTYNRLIAQKHWDTLNANPGLIYSCGEDYYQYDSHGKVSIRTSYINGGTSPKYSTQYLYNTVPQVIMEIRTEFPYGYTDTSKYVYYPGKIEYNYSNGQYQDIYFVNSSNNVDSVHSNNFGNYVYSYDGKVNPQKDFRSRWGAYNMDQNVVNIMDSQFSVLSTNSYIYNSNNLPLICNTGNQITYYFYE